MKLAHFFVGFFIIFSSTFSFSQDSISSWKHKNTVGFDLSEIAFVNWSAGGQSSVSGLLKGDFNRTYKRQNVLWLNELIVRYGVNKQDGVEVRKTDDVLRFNSTFGYRKDTLSNWYHSIKFNFNTQFTNTSLNSSVQLVISSSIAVIIISLFIIKPDQLNFDII